MIIIIENYNSFIPLNYYNFHVQMFGGEKHLLSRVSVASQSTPTMLFTVLVYTDL